MPLVALTAWQALQQASPKAGQRVLINAASGGVGHVAVQARRAAGSEWQGSAAWVVLRAAVVAS